MEEVRDITEGIEVPPGASRLTYIIPDEYKTWHVRNTQHDLQSDKYIVVLTKEPVYVYQWVEYENDKAVIKERLA